jgi:2-iminobutanoate/2-iminopropanoate deaminase
VSTCTRAGNMVFVSGMPPFDPETGEILVHAPFERQVELILEQVKKALEAAGSDLDHVLKCNVLCISADRFKAFNEVYKRYFPKNPQPASSSACLSGPGPSTSRSIAWRSRRTDLGRQRVVHPGSHAGPGLLSRNNVPGPSPTDRGKRVRRSRAAIYASGSSIHFLFSRPGSARRPGPYRTGIGSSCSAGGSPIHSATP